MNKLLNKIAVLIAEYERKHKVTVSCIATKYKDRLFVYSGNTFVQMGPNIEKKVIKLK